MLSQIWPLLVFGVVFVLQSVAVIFPLPLPIETLATGAFLIVLTGALYKSAMFFLHLFEGRDSLKSLKEKTTANFIVSIVAAVLFFSAWFNTQVAEKAALRVTPPVVRWTPLVLDMNRDGKVAVTEKKAVYFDVGGDDFKEATTWIDPADSLLVVDRNGNGKADDGTEVIGGQNRLMLRDFRAKFYIWTDKNQDGISQEDELAPLDAVKNKPALLGLPLFSVRTEDGGSYKLISATLEGDEVNTTFGGDVNLELAAFALPELRGYGKAPNLSIAMSRDPELLKIAQELAALPVEKIFLDFKGTWEKFDALLFRLARVHTLAPDSRGPNVDARKLAYMETIFSKQFRQMGVGSPNPAPNAGRGLMETYDSMKGPLMARFFAQSAGKSLFRDLLAYDRLGDGLLFDGAGKTPALSTDIIKKLGEEGKAAQDKLAYWSSIAFFIQRIKGAGEGFQPQEVEALDAAVKASDPRLDWEKVSKNYFDFIPCAPCTLLRQPSSFSDAAKKTARPAWARPYYTQIVELRKRDPRQEAVENAMKGDYKLQRGGERGACNRGFTTGFYDAEGSDGQGQASLEKEVRDFYHSYNVTLMMMPDYPHAHICSPAPQADIGPVIAFILEKTGITREEYDRRRQAQREASLLSVSFFGLNDKVQQFLDKGADPSVEETVIVGRDTVKTTALERAVIGDKADTLALLVRYKNAILSKGVLRKALLSKNPDISKIARSYFAKGKDVTLLHQAIREGNMDLIDFLIEAGEDVNYSDSGYAHTPLPIVLAAQKEDVALLKKILAAGASLQEPVLGLDILWVIMRSKAGQNPDVVRFFLDNGSKVPNVRTADSLEILKLLVEHGASLTDTRDDGSNVLTANISKKDIVAFLLEKLPADFTWATLTAPSSKQHPGITIYDTAPPDIKLLLDKWITSSGHDLSLVKRGREETIEAIGQWSKDGGVYRPPAAYIHPDYLKDKDFVLSVFEGTTGMFALVRDTFNGDKDFILKTFSNRNDVANYGREGHPLKFASEALRDDREVVLEAVKSWGKAIQFASERLKDDPDVIRAALAKDGWALQFLGTAARDNAEYVRLALSSQPDALYFASDRLQEELYPEFFAEK